MTDDVQHNGQEPDTDAGPDYSTVLLTNGVVMVRNAVGGAANSLAEVPVVAIEALIAHIETNLEEARSKGPLEPAAELAANAELASYRIMLDARRALVELGESTHRRAQVIDDLAGGAEQGRRLRRPRR